MFSSRAREPKNASTEKDHVVVDHMVGVRIVLRFDNIQHSLSIPPAGGVVESSDFEEESSGELSYIPQLP